MRQTELKPLFMNVLPDWDHMEQGVLYISEKYGVCKHFCACGCSGGTVLPFGESGGWKMTNNNGLISFTPSVGNFSGENPYHAHYYITDNKVVWC